MDAMDPVEQAASRIAFAIGEPARSRILFCLMDGRARTSTELSAVADVGTSTASVHLERLVKARLVRVAAEGRYRYFSLAGPEVGHLLEGLTAIAGAGRSRFVPSTPSRLRQARSCYDHLAGSLGVALHDRLLAMGWISDAHGAGAMRFRKQEERGCRKSGSIPATKRDAAGASPTDAWIGASVAVISRVRLGRPFLGSRSGKNGCFASRGAAGSRSAPLVGGNSGEHSDWSWLDDGAATFSREKAWRPRRRGRTRPSLEPKERPLDQGPAERRKGQGRDSAAPK